MMSSIATKAAAVRLPPALNSREGIRCWHEFYRLFPGLAAMSLFDHHRLQLFNQSNGRNHAEHKQLATPRLRADHRR